MNDRAASIPRPLPKLEGLTGHFYDCCRKGELRFQRCTNCGCFRHPPRELCAECRSFVWEWAPSTGHGTVFTYTIVERALHPAFAGATPYAAAVVEFPEGVRLLSRVIDVAPADLRIGMPVHVAFEALSETVTVPVFRFR